MEKWKEKPCIGCSRVENPDRCDNKDCKRWQRWFIHRWEQLRRAAGKGEGQ